MHNIRRSITCLSTVKRQASWSCRRLASSTSSSEEIEIPNRIHRSPIDILKALSQTVGRDSTAPHYKYHDDPYLIPLSNVAKRTYAMAQESGRKSATWIKQQNSHLFQVSCITGRVALLMTRILLVAHRDGSTDRSLHSSQSLHRGESSGVDGSRAAHRRG